MCSITAADEDVAVPSQTASTSTSIAPSRNRSIRTGWSGDASAAVRTKRLELLVVVDDLHRAAAEHVGGPHDDRVPDLRRRPSRASSHRARLAVRRRGDLELVRGSAANFPRSSARSIASGEVPRIAKPSSCRIRASLQRRLAAELGDHAHRPLGAADRQHVLGRERLEVQPARGVVVGRDGLGVRVHHHRLEPGLLERERRVHAGVVELDPLADPVRPGAEDHDARPVGGQRPRSPPRRSSSGTACAPGTRPPHVSTVLNTGATPSASRWRRTAASVAPVSSAEARVRQPEPLRVAKLHGGQRRRAVARAAPSPSSTTSAIWSTNHGSMPEAAATSSTVTPGVQRALDQVEPVLGAVTAGRSSGSAVERRRRTRRRGRTRSSRARARPCRAPP